jgi:hypothetical protein
MEGECGMGATMEGGAVIFHTTESGRRSEICEVAGGRNQAGAARGVGEGNGILGAGNAGCRRIGSRRGPEGEEGVDCGFDHGFRERSEVRERSEGEDVGGRTRTMWTPTLHS